MSHQSKDMSNNDDKPRKGLKEAVEDMQELGHTLADNINTGKRIARREAIAAARNPHVESLTVGRKVWDRGEHVTLNADQRHELEFHIRRMWAITLLANMKSYGFTWDGIRKLTGKTRQTWNNVTNSGYVPRHILKLDSDNEERREYIDGASYRPVTNSFIRSVTQHIARANYTTHTSAFCYAITHHLTVWENDFLDLEGDDQFIIGRVGEQYFKDAKGDGVEVCAAVPQLSGDTVPVDMFPLLGIDDHTINNHFAHEQVIAVEWAAYGYRDGQTKEPHPNAKMALEMWKQEQNAMADHWSEPIPTDPKEFRAPTTPKPEQKPPTQSEFRADPLPEPLTVVPTDIIKADDGSSATDGLGFYPAVQLPFECHPNWFNDGTGEATFEVKVMYRNGVKSGHSIVLKDTQ